MAFKLRSQTPYGQSCFNTDQVESPLHQTRSMYERIAKPYYSYILGLEEKVNNFLDRPMDKAQTRRGKFEKKTNGNYATSDKVNHAAAGMYTRKAISNKLGGGVLGNAIGVIGANILGVGHELSAFNTDQGYLNGAIEAGKDIINNTIGSLSTDKNLESNVQKYGTSGMSNAEEKYRLKDINSKKKSPVNQKKSPLHKQKLSPKATKAKAKRDLAYAETPDRRAKKAEDQRRHRADPKGKGKDWDHEDQHWEDAHRNRGNDGNGTKKESGKKYKITKK